MSVFGIILIRQSRLLRNSGIGKPEKLMPRCVNKRFLQTMDNIVPVQTTFHNGFFRYEVGNEKYTVSYWTPVSQLPELHSMNGAATTSSTQETLADIPSPNEQSKGDTFRIKDATGLPLDTANPLALGVLLKESSQVEWDTPQGPVTLSLNGLVDDLMKWEKKEHPPALFQAQVLMTERDSLLVNYTPLKHEFMQLLMEAEDKAQARFKWGGLFLLSSQLGFVARLTWFEYSWDIMEPITWCLTYSMMLVTFSYYIMTSQEFLLPVAERRAVQEKFWKIVKKQGFNVDEFRRLRRRLLSLNRKLNIAKTQSGDMIDRILFK